ncbi:MAG: DNA translocase FtsK 4TM domain-containing protein, partial [Pseudomonadota bacterium]
MAYQTKQRDPLLDSAMQAALEKRGRELIGLVLLAAGLATAMMLASYVPDDASFFSSQGTPAQNWLGRLGASMAAPLVIVVGLGAWVIAGLFLAWGLRVAANRGVDRAIARAVFSPVAIVMAAVYASTLVPGETWAHSFGLGGLLGDTTLGALLNILPVKASAGLKAIALPLGLGAIALFLFSAGFTMAELRHITRFVVYGVLMAYDSIARVVATGASGTAAAAQSFAAHRAARRDARIESDTLIDEGDEEEFTPRPLRIPDEPPVTRTAAREGATPAPRPGLLSQVSGLVRRAPEPALEPELPEVDA